MLVKFLPEISGVFKHPKHPIVTVLYYACPFEKFRNAM